MALIKDMTLRLIAEGLTNAEVAARVRAEVSGARTTPASVAWYRANCRGEPREARPPRPAEARPLKLRSTSRVQLPAAKAPTGEPLRWRREEKHHGLGRVVQGVRGWRYGMKVGGDAGVLNFDADEQKWVGEVRVERTQARADDSCPWRLARLIPRWDYDQVEAAKAAVVAAVRKYNSTQWLES